MVSNRRVLFLYKLEINRIERIYRFKSGIRSTDWRARGKRYCVRKKFKRNGRGLLGRRWPAGRDDCVEKGLIGRCEVLRMGW